MPAFLIMRKLHLLRADKAVEEIGFDVAELGTVSEDFIDSVRQHIEIQDKLKEEVAIKSHFKEQSFKIEPQKDDEKKNLI